MQEAIDDRPTLHLDDFSEIPRLAKFDTSAIVQERARLRAVEGDWVVQSQQTEPGYSDYCEYRLGLGRVNWLFPAQQPHDPHQLAVSCWHDRRLRHDLMRAIRHDDLFFVHPHMSTGHVWELAWMLSRATRRPIKVIGPTPWLANWANDKIEFTQAAARLLGSHKVPYTEVAGNFAKLAQQVMRLATTHQRVGVKYPLGTGGSGNFLIESADIRHLSLVELRRVLKERLQGYHWPAGGRLLVDAWEDGVLSSPSVQTWIPPRSAGAPVIEGIFQQLVVGRSYQFIGSQPAHLPASLEQQIVDDSYLLALMFQELGYIGRCSFDLILLGEDAESPDSRFEFIECNGRWGGTSLPMTLMNRLAVPDSGKSWCVRRLTIPGLERLAFSDLQRHLGPLLYDRRAHFGQYVLFCPARMAAQSAIDAISIGNSPQEASHLICQALPQILKRLVNQHPLTGKAENLSDPLGSQGESETLQ